MVELLIFGQPYWSTEIARAINSRQDDLRARYVAPRAYVATLRLGRPNEPTVLMRAGYRPGASTPRGRLFDGYWSALRWARPSAVACHYWLGSDVQDTLAEMRTGTIRAAVLAATRSDLHLADAPWLASELAEVGIEAVTAHVPQPNRAPDTVRPLPADFAVLTYLPGARFDFYGGTTILEVAARIPDVRFDVVGRQSVTPPVAPPNVRYLGWVADMTPRYTDTTAVIRIPRHDGLGQTIIEGLLHGRHALYIHHVPHVRRVQAETGSVATALKDLLTTHRAGRLEANHAGRAYALKAFDETALTDHLVGLIQDRL